MLNKEEITQATQEWFDVDKKHADLFAEDLLKKQDNKAFWADTIPTIALVIIMWVYVVFHW